MRLVLRISGSLLEDVGVVRLLAQQIGKLAGNGAEVLAIHGGDRLLSATLTQSGSQSRFDAGLRIVDQSTRDAAVNVAGVLSKRLASSICTEGQPAVAVSANGRGCFLAEPLVRNDISGFLGYVGYLASLNTEFLSWHWRQEIVPVTAPFGKGTDGNLYCINADHMAAACAEYLGADQLIYLTRAPAVLNNGNALSSVSCRGIDTLVHGGLLSVGMILRLESAKRAIEGGVRAVRIVNGAEPGALLSAAAAEDIGTVVSHDHHASTASFAVAAMAH